MKTEVRNGHIFAPKETNLKDNCRCSYAGEDTCYKTGKQIGAMFVEIEELIFDFR